jgi:hypothetical protein
MLSPQQQAVRGEWGGWLPVGLVQVSDQSPNDGSNRFVTLPGMARQERVVDVG